MCRIRQATGFATCQGELQALIQDPLEGGFGDAEVGGREAAVQAPDPLVADRLLDAVPAVAVLAAEARLVARVVLVELDARLHHPDWIGGGAGGDAGDGGGGEVDRPHVLAAFGVEVVVEDALAVAVDVEVDAAGGDHSDEDWG